MISNQEYISELGSSKFTLGIALNIGIILVFTGIEKLCQILPQILIHSVCKLSKFSNLNTSKSALVTSKEALSL